MCKLPSLPRNTLRVNAALDYSSNSYLHSVKLVYILALTCKHGFLWANPGLFLFIIVIYSIQFQ